MNVIIDFFTGIAEAVTTAIKWLGQMISDLVYVAGLLAKFVATIPTYFSWIPAEALLILVVILGLVVIYKLIGREG